MTAILAFITIYMVIGLFLSAVVFTLGKEEVAELEQSEVSGFTKADLLIIVTFGWFAVALMFINHCISGGGMNE